MEITTGASPSKRDRVEAKSVFIVGVYLEGCTKETRSDVTETAERVSFSRWKNPRRQSWLVALTKFTRRQQRRNIESKQGRRRGGGKGEKLGKQQGAGNTSHFSRGQTLKLHKLLAAGWRDLQAVRVVRRARLSTAPVVSWMLPRVCPPQIRAFSTTRRREGACRGARERVGNEDEKRSRRA